MQVWIDHGIKWNVENLVRSFSGVFTVNLSAPVWALWRTNWKGFWKGKVGHIRLKCHTKWSYVKRCDLARAEWKEKSAASLSTLSRSLGGKTFKDKITFKKSSLQMASCKRRCALQVRWVFSECSAQCNVAQYNAKCNAVIIWFLYTLVRLAL